MSANSDSGLQFHFNGKKIRWSQWQITRPIIFSNPCHWLAAINRNEWDTTTKWGALRSYNLFRRPHWRCMPIITIQRTQPFADKSKLNDGISYSLGAIPVNMLSTCNLHTTAAWSSMSHCVCCHRIHCYFYSVHNKLFAHAPETTTDSISYCGWALYVFRILSNEYNFHLWVDAIVFEFICRATNDARVLCPFSHPIDPSYVYWKKGIGLLKLIACTRHSHMRRQTTTTSAAAPAALESTLVATGVLSLSLSPSRMSINTIFQFRLLQQSRLLFCWHEIAISYRCAKHTVHCFIPFASALHTSQWIARARVCLAAIAAKATIVVWRILGTAFLWLSCQSSQCAPRWCALFFFLRSSIAGLGRNILEFTAINHGG